MSISKKTYRKEAYNMGLRFHKSIKIGPARVNFSKSGIGYSVGTKGARITKSAKGKTRATVGIPGTGLSYSKSIGSNKKKSSASRSKATANARKIEPVSSTNETQTHGCLSVCIGIIGLGLVIGLIKQYWTWVLALLLLTLAAYIAFRFYQKKKTQPALEKAAETNDQNAKIEPGNDDSPFETEIQAIPKAEISVSDPVPRHLLKDLPPYDFKNITRSTRLDSIFPLVVLDTETTGLYPSKHEIIEVSAIKFDYGMVPIACFSSLCKPRNPIPEEISAINHITDDMVADAPAFSQIAPALTEFLHGCNLVGHNLDFDLRFIFAHGADLPTEKRFYDTLDLAQLTIPNGYISNYKLDTLCRYYRIHHNTTHRAISDCYATAKIFSHLVFDKTSRQLEADTDGETGAMTE